MLVYLIRHTKPKIEKGICYGFSDIELANSYQREKQILLDKIEIQLQKNKEKITEIIIYTSPLKRCQVLANDLKNDLNIKNQNNFVFKVKKNRKLKEMNFGKWELKKWNQINETQLRKWTDNFVTECVPDGESFEVLNKRVIDFWQNKIESKTKIAEPNTIIFVVCHAGVIRSILCHVLQIPLRNAFSISINYGSITKLKTFKTHTQIESVNH